MIRIHVPPLRQRREEIPHLATFFLREASDRLGKPDVQLGSDVLDLFAQYWWPGNVRQLRNEMQRAVAMAPAGRHNRSRAPVGGPHGDAADRACRPVRRAWRIRGGQTLASVVDEIERDLIREMMNRHRGNISETARALGLTRRGLYLKLRRLGLENAPDVATK